MKRLVLVLFLPVAGCHGAEVSNSLFMQEVSSEFQSGQSWEDVKSQLVALGDDDLQLYNPCNAKHEDIPSPCHGYQLIATIPLPFAHRTAGPGVGQMYFSFSPDQILREHHFEIYYENRH